MNDKILYWSDDEKRCVLNHVKQKGKPPLIGDTIILSVKLSKKFCELFGFVEKTFYEIFWTSKIRNTVAR